MTTLVPAGPYLPTTLTDSGGPLDHDIVHQAIADATAELQAAASLHGALLGVKVWSTGSSAYIWSGDGSAPSAGAYTQILFIDPTGTHDPATSTGGRSNADDLWETGTSGGSATGGLIATKAYNPGSAVGTSTTSATYADIDTTNLAITFTVPASGQVIVVLGAEVSCLASQGIGWGLRSGGSNVTGSTAQVTFNGNSFQCGSRISLRLLITGLTPAASLTYTWSHARTSGSTTVYTYYGGTSGQALMEVWAA